MNELPNQIETADVAALSARPLLPFRPAHSRRPCNAQFALPIVPRRLPCRTKQSIRAAQHAAELAEWQVSGGDYLSSAFATLFAGAYRYYQS